MSDLTIRAARLSDAPAIIELINQIIEQGGSTAYQTPWTDEFTLKKMQTDTDRSSWIVALKGDTLMGFQYFQPHPELPKDAPSIATFVRIGAVKMGIGSALFHETLKAAHAIGYTWINATILEHNTGGHSYYASRGFQIWNIDTKASLEDGTQVTKISRRYDL
ncbi:MAG: GNAT family N-acetyltransferase [Planktomarina sp.]